MAQNQIPKEALSDTVFDNLTNSFVKFFLTSFMTNDPKQSGKITNRLILLGLAILVFVGDEVTKIIFRKNFGRTAISYIKFILSSIVFLIIAYFAYDGYINYDQSIDHVSTTGSRFSFLFAAIFYFSLVIVILLKAISSKIRIQADRFDAYQGDSSYLSFLMNDGWSQSRVQNVAEPLFLLALGIFFFGLNTLWGVPLIICAISYWLHLLGEGIISFVLENGIKINALDLRNTLADLQGIKPEQRSREAY